jgi:hypothetical protein
VKGAILSLTLSVGGKEFVVVSLVMFMINNRMSAGDPSGPRRAKPPALNAARQMCNIYQ